MRFGATVAKQRHRPRERLSPATTGIWRDDLASFMHRAVQMLFLFDIDGTLLRRMPPAHRRALCAACETVFGVAVQPEDLGRTAGMTDTAILIRMLAAAGVDRDSARAQLERLYTVAADAYERLVDDDLTPYLTPHATETLDWLNTHGAALGLVTGNIQRIAWRKLGAAGLTREFRCGAFGDEAELREALPPLAHARAEAALARRFAAHEVFIVGDTPSDIACGVASGYRTIGVATGPEHSLDELRACGAEYALDDLRGLEPLGLYG